MISDSHLERFGKPLVEFSKYVIQLARIVVTSVYAAREEPIRGRRMIGRVLGSQIFFTGWGAMPVLSVLAVATGAVIVFYTADRSALLSGGGVGGSFLHVIILRELGPLVVALLVIARSGTAIASELGAMSANRELDALRAMSISPLGFLIFPRILGGVLSVCCLSFYFDLIAIGASFLALWALQDLSLLSFMGSFLSEVTGDDVLLIFTKNILNGLIIFSVCTYQGMQVKQSLHEVPQVTTKAVVVSISAVTACNFLVTAIWYLKQYEMTRL